MVDFPIKIVVVVVAADVIEISSSIADGCPAEVAEEEKDIV